MDRSDLLGCVVGGENSTVEFKRDDCRPDDLAKEMAALLNLEGGVILLGVEDDGASAGLTRTRKKAEKWVMNIARANIQPAVIPTWTCVAMDDGKVVGVIRLRADGPGKPYKARRGSVWLSFTRVGSTSRESSREEEGRLYQSAKLVRYETRAVPDMILDQLDMRRLESYYQTVLRRSSPNRDNVCDWNRLLLNSDLLVDDGEGACATVLGMLLFGRNPNRRLPQAGVTAAAFPESEKDYDMVDQEHVRGPLVSLISSHGHVVEEGVIDRAVGFVRRNMGNVAWLDGARRMRKDAFPLDAVREAIVNAVVHRDYGYEGTDIEVSLYRDRAEIVSPGRLPNGVTVQKMREGVVRAARNSLLKDILRDYGYVEHQGMGVRRRIIDSMRRHNGTETDLVEDAHRFTVRLWKESNPDA